MRLILILLLVCVFFCGCQYAQNRLWDAADCGGASVTVGPGFMVDAQATWLARAGIGTIHGKRYAVYYGKPSETSIVTGIFGVAPLLFVDYLCVNDRFLAISGTILSLPFAGGPGDIDDISIANPFLDPSQFFTGRHDKVMRSAPPRELCGTSFMDIGFSIHIVYFGAELRFRLAEFIDFLLGFTTLDIMGDNIRAQSQRPPPEAPRRKAWWKPWMIHPRR